MLLQDRALAALRRGVGAGLVALAVVVGALALGGSPPVLADAAPTLYGQVVDVGPGAIVLSLQNSGEWVAVNTTPQTVVSSQSGGAASLGGIQQGDWALVAYSVSRQSENGAQATWFVARTITYSTSPVSTGGQSVRIVGKVVAMQSGGFSMRANNGTAWSVSVTGATSVLLGNAVSALSLLQVGDVVQVWGTAAGSYLVATRVVYRVTGRHGQQGPHGQQRRGRYRGSRRG
jgi:hypothetical protein